jgi:hypothetical protein
LPVHAPATYKARNRKRAINHTVPTREFALLEAKSGPQHLNRMRADGCLHHAWGVQPVAAGVLTSGGLGVPGQRIDGANGDGDNCGTNTNFVTGVTQVSAGAGINVSNISVTNATTLTAQFALAPSAALGPRSIAVITGSEEATLPNGFRVQP